MLKVLDPGIFTTIQDAGRWGYQAYGVPVSGAMDLPALRVANQLVRNPPDEAALEIHSPVALQSDTSCLIAVTGMDARFEINGRAMPPWTSIFARAGASIEIAPKRAGRWLYLAIQGGIDVPSVLGSKSTFLRGKFGGLEGRALAAGDEIRIGAQTIGNLVAAAGRGAGEPPHHQSEIRIILGPHDDCFTPQAVFTLTHEEYFVTATADRMGYRLKGSAPSTRLLLATLPTAEDRNGYSGEGELVSCGVSLGAIQVPPDGQPIVLMVDHPTTGGYPIIATVMAEDIVHIAQHAPGDRLAFRAIDLK
jgi:antagonist of KipI